MTRSPQRTQAVPHTTDDRVLGRLEAFLVRHRSVGESLAWTAGALIAATLTRCLAGFAIMGLPLLFYVPAIAVVTAVAGWRYGVAALVASGPLGWWLFGEPSLFYGGSAHDAMIVTTTVWFLLCGVMVVIVSFVRSALLRAETAEARYRKLLGVAFGIIWTMDAEGRASGQHEVWQQVTGMSWPDYEGHGWLNAFHEEDRAAVLPHAKNQSGHHEFDARLWDVKFGDWRWYRGHAALVPSLSGGPDEWLVKLRDDHDQKTAHDRRELALGEMRHRMKNLVTIIDALAKSSRVGRNTEVDAFLRRFLGRLHALGAAADQVLAAGRSAIECNAAIKSALGPFQSDCTERFRIEGPQITLTEETGGSIAMALHELATNAVKYGALSVPDGHVTVRWALLPAENGERFLLEWIEHGGPAPSQPERDGFGSRVIRAAAARERNGEVEIDYDPRGLVCRISFLRTGDVPARPIAV